ncbi:hypothetical protein Pcinc_014100 [Petrolisthes cinctipes]|uniref:Reverse transcriptase n=1 Tax=Petrolisthes cinctipes TaxID=88211 RepID=A0AAE1FVP9_PETCI|nr:hypothetical protein Pcinc_014100 [Petrolisthes cinctipes]
MAPHSTDPGELICRHLVLHAPATRVTVHTAERQLETSNKGINVIASLDDWVIWDTSHELTAKAVNTATSLLSNLGFLINVPKSHLHPSTDVVWLGIRWFPLLGRWALLHLGHERVNLAHKLFRSSSSPFQNSPTCIQDFFPHKFKGRQPEQTFDHLNRVVTSKTNLQGDSNIERPIRSRSNDNKQKQEGTFVLLPSSRPKGSCFERTGPRLEQMESNLSLPSKVATPSGAEETGNLPSPQSDNSPLVSNGALVQLNTEQVNKLNTPQPR